MDQHTKEQQAAYERFQQVSEQTRILLSGEDGPHGATLRMFTPEEQQAWEAYQESLLTPEEKLLRLIELFVFSFWEEHIGNTRQLSVWWNEEVSPEDHSAWVKDGEIKPDDRLFSVRLAHGPNVHNYVDVWTWVIRSPDDQLALLGVECNGIEIEGVWCDPGQIPVNLTDEVKAFSNYCS